MGKNVLFYLKLGLNFSFKNNGFAFYILFSLKLLRQEKYCFDNNQTIITQYGPFSTQPYRVYAYLIYDKYKEYTQLCSLHYFQTTFSLVSVLGIIN